MSTALTTANRLGGDARAHTEKTVAEIQAALAAPFWPDQLGWKPQATTKDGTKAMAVPYIDARDVQDRLDEVVGIAGWKDEYNALSGGAVQCRLSLKLEGEWVTKEDVGGQSEQPDGGDRQKAAVSDALKRAAVKFGVARYLYSFPTQWVAYDGQKKQFTGTPRIPEWALPAKAKAPKDGAELKRRLAAKDVELAAAGAITAGDLVKAVETEAKKGKWDAEWVKWSAEQVGAAGDIATAFIRRLSSDKG